MFSNKVNLIFVLALMTLCWGCSHEDEGFDGPNLVERFGPFNVVTDLSASQSTVDFAAGETVFFTAEFNKSINWVITITGMESGAVKRIEGFDRKVSADNATWDGGTTDLPLFRDEMCTAVLTIVEESYTSSTVEVTTLSQKVYGGTLYSDFETFDIGANGEFGNYEFELTPDSGVRMGDETIVAPEGDKFVYIAGTDFENNGQGTDNFFVGLIDLYGSASGGDYVSLPTTVPEEVYFNCFLYSNGSQHGLAIVDFFMDTNDSGDFQPSDAGYRFQMDTGDWSGWQFVSFPMSEVYTVDGEGNLTDDSPTQAELEKFVNMRLLLISQNNEQPSPREEVGFGIDYITFTQGGPLDL